MLVQFFFFLHFVFLKFQILLMQELLRIRQQLLGMRIEALKVSTDHRLYLELLNISNLKLHFS
jgi:hypothetical protein